MISSAAEPTAPRVAHIVLFPIKACGGISVDAAQVGPYGLRGDRGWQIIDANGAPITQRTHPILATVRPQFATTDEQTRGEQLHLNVAGYPSLTVEPSAVCRSATTITNQPTEAFDAGDEAAAWFSELLNQPARLVALSPDVGIDLPSALHPFTQQIGFSDLSAVLVANTASYQWLAERASEPFPLERFRANIVVEGIDPFIEETWASFTIGEATFTHAQPMPRCTVPQVDQETGERHKEPAKVLRKYRWVTQTEQYADYPVVQSIVENSAVFGIGCRVEPVAARIKVGDPTTPTGVREPVLAPPSDPARNVRPGT